MAKGATFERDISKVLSQWWSVGLGGVKRDDIFWRSSQSGGRATQRAKFGKDTYGSYGDITALDPIGEPLMRFATIELKRGYKDTPWDLLECKRTGAVRPFEKALVQAQKSSIQSGSLGWILIGKRDRRRPVIYVERKLHRLYANEWPSSTFSNWCIFHLEVNRIDLLRPAKFHFVAIDFEEWLAVVRPNQIIECL